MARSRALTKIELEKRHAWFEEWVKTIDDRIEAWKEKLPVHVSQSLDKSPDSLIILEEYLIKTYPDSDSATDPALADTIDAIATYIGEVYKLNLPGNQVWRPSTEIMETENPQFYFYCEVGLDFKKGGKNPASNIPFVLYNKPGRKLYEYYYILKKLTEEAIINEEERKTQKPIPGRGGYSYQHFILLKNNSYKLLDLESTLRRFYSKKKNAPEVYLVNDVRLVVEMSKEFCFHFWYDDRPSVLAESKEISNDYKGNKKDKESISSCAYRIEFWGDSDSKGEFFNEHLYILDEIVQIQHVFVFSLRQGIFYDEM